MNLRADQELNEVLAKLHAAEAELEAVRGQLRSFEETVDTRLGSLLDKLSDLNVENTELDGKLRHIREVRLFGPDLMQYLDGAPRAARSLNLADMPPTELAHRRGFAEKTDHTATNTDKQIPEIKVLYRRLARRYHPDLARNDADRAQSNDQMKEINRAYAAGDLPTLLKLAGMSLPNGIDLGQPIKPQSISHQPMTEMESAQRKLSELRQQISRLSNLPIVKLSLDVKLARHQGRDLLSEMEAELQYKVARKIAEGDYLRSQIAANEG
jgi:DnaJ domain